MCCINCCQMVFAAQSCGGTETIILSCDDDKGVSHILRLVVDILSIGVGIVGVIGIAWVGIQYMSARENPEAASKARRRFFEVLIGLVCYALLYSAIAWLLPGGISEVIIPQVEENGGGSTSNSGPTSKSPSGKDTSKSPSSPNSKNTAKATVSEKNRKNMIAMQKGGKNVTIVGDSITYRTLKAGSFSKKLGKASIKCQPGKRTFNDDRANGGPAGNGGKSGKTIINELISGGKLRDIVVIALGSNDGGAAALSAESLQELVDTINKDGRHSIYFVTNYNYHKKGNTGTFKKINYSKNNNAFKALQANNNNVMVIDWAKIVSENPKKYMVDYVHPKKGAGTDLFAETIYRGLTGQ